MENHAEGAKKHMAPLEGHCSPSQHAAMGHKPMSPSNEGRMIGQKAPEAGAGDPLALSLGK